MVERGEPGKVSEVVVVGAGLAGLACAVHLHQAGLEVVVLEASDAPGGRVRSDRVDGFTLDRGFQVYLTAYPRAGQLLDLDELDLRRFIPGALVRVDDGFHELSDPWRRPAQALSAIQAPVGTWADKLRVARLRSQLGKPPIDDLLQRPERSTRRHLEELGFGPQIIDRFFQPFLAGIFLDATLETSSRMFEFVFRMFSQGDAAIPAGGMERIPQQLASRLPTGAIRTNVRVTQRDGTAAVTSEGERIAGRVLVVATDGSTAAHLVPDLQVPDWRGVHGLYFAAGQPPLQEAMLALNGNGRGLVNNLCVISQVAPEYAPEGASLVSVSVLESASLDDKSLAAAVQGELVEWFGPQVALWRHLRTYAIPQALPAQRPPGLGPRPVRVSGAPRVYVCGDHRWTSSIEGAIASGLEAASAVLEDLR